MKSQQKLGGDFLIIAIIVIEQPQTKIAVQRQKLALQMPTKPKLRRKLTIARDYVPCGRVESDRSQGAIQGGFREVDVFQQSGHGRLRSLGRKEGRDEGITDVAAGCFLVPPRVGSRRISMTMSQYEMNSLVTSHASRVTSCLVLGVLTSFLNSGHQTKALMTASRNASSR